MLRKMMIAAAGAAMTLSASAVAQNMGRPGMG